MLGISTVKNLSMGGELAMVSHEVMAECTADVDFGPKGGDLVDVLGRCSMGRDQRHWPRLGWETWRIVFVSQSLCGRTYNLSRFGTCNRRRRRQDSSEVIQAGCGHSSDTTPVVFTEPWPAVSRCPRRLKLS
jgi:hypothetical protein